MIPIEVRSKEKNLEGNIRQYTERRIGFALDHLRDLRRIVVSIEDVNGPKGGPDKRCHILAEFAFSSISLEETQCNWQTAIARAIHKLDRAATNKLHRMNRSRSHRAFSHASKSSIRSWSQIDQESDSTSSDNLDEKATDSDKFDARIESGSRTPTTGLGEAPAETDAPLGACSR